MDDTAFYNPFDQMNTNQHACFLCGEVVDTQSREHVFPRWLLQRQGLLDEQLTLLNGTRIPYRQITISCCQECNNQHLSKLETTIEMATRKGVDEVRELPEEFIFQWITKIFIGLLWTELRLKADRASASSDPIIAPEVIKELSTLHGHLQSVRRPFIFQNPKPWSLFISKMHKFEQKMDFDYHDALFNLCFGIRFSGVGIIACLQDNGTQKICYGECWDPLHDIPLHCQQWDEMWAKVVYRNSLLLRTPKYMTIMPSTENDPVNVISLPTAGLAPETMWKDWDQKQYAEILLRVLQQKMPETNLSQIYAPPDKVMSWTFNADGSVNAVDAKGNKLKT